MKLFERTMSFRIILPVLLDLLNPRRIRLGIQHRDYHHRRAGPYRDLCYCRSASASSAAYPSQEP